MAEEARAEGTGAFVVIGASAGGLEALQSLVANLPPDLPAPLVIAQHLDPTQPSHLGEILAAHTALPVRVLSDHSSLPLEPGVVFVVPANRHVRVTARELIIAEDGVERPKPSIDRLLADAAAVYGEGAIAVILTGRGADGAAGARAIKAAGGTVIVQDPTTARYPAMPAAVDPTMVDITADLTEIGPTLRALLSGEALPATPGRERALHAFLEEVRQRSGIDFGQYKLPTIRRRLQRRLAAVGTTSLEDYRRYLQGHPEEYMRLVNSFLIKVTEFFRDPALYAYLRTHVAPDLIAHARTHNKTLRIWSSGCATGQEAYSLAIVVAEALGDALEQFEVRIFATDLDAAAIDVARHGIYPPGDLAALPPDVVARHFTRLDGAYAVSARIRALTVFGEHDLAQRAPFPHIDLCVCRNVLIYFTPALQEHALRLFAFAVRDGGYLVLGPSETVRPIESLFAPVAPGLKIYRRQGERLALGGMAPGALVIPRPAPNAARRARLSPSVEETRPDRERLARGLLALPVGVVVVDRRYDIQLINTAARRLLGIHRDGLGEDLIHLARGLDAAALRSIVDAAFRPGAPSALKTERVPEAPGTPRADRLMSVRTVDGEELTLQVACYPHAAGIGGSPGGDTALLVVLDVTRTERARRVREELEAREAAERVRLEEQYQAELARMTTRVEALASANAELLAANMEMSAAIADVRGQNEDLQMRAEEAQAATEEVETLNEELQASNEELQASNEEMQATVEELNTTNVELRAQGLEREEQATVLDEQRATTEAERERLQAVLDEMADAVLVVDSQGQTVLINAAYDRLAGPDGQLAPLDVEGKPIPLEATPGQRAARGETFTMAFTVTTSADEQHWGEAVGRPVRREGAMDWGVVVIRDITERTLRRLQDEFLALVSHELRTPLTPIMGYLDMLTNLLQAEENSEKAQGYARLAREQVERLHGLVGDLLDVGRLQGGKLSLDRAPLDLEPVVMRAVEAARQAAAAQGQEVALTAPEGPVRVRGDARRLEQVVLNLLNNAVTYAARSPRIDVQLGRANGSAVLEVRDAGPGIPEAALPHLFDRFYQVDRLTGPSRQGLGLGLFLTKELVEAHDGTIAVQSAEGVGTTFTVRLSLLGDLEASESDPG